MARKRKRGRALRKRYGRTSAVSKRRGHSYVEGAASVPVRVHGTLYISPEPIAGAVIDAIEESPRLVEEIAEAVADEGHDYWPPERHFD